MRADSQSEAGERAPDTARQVYPPSPHSLPLGLTDVTLAYRLRVVATLISMLLFLALYFSMLVGAAWVVLFTLELVGEPTLHRGFVWWLAAVFCAALFVFLVKGLFKRNRVDRSEMIEVEADEEPRLFSFLRRLCDETGAAFPKKVYLSHGVNAGVFYDSSFLSLFLPVRKNLVIGLGLLNALNLSELKGVLGHEFGHFSQKSMRLGSYVYVTNQLLVDMVWGRDAFDRMLDGAARIDIRLTVFVWLFQAILWLLRKFLELLFRLINISHRSLSRQMEFAADRIAVSVAGSDAIVHALLKASFADACMEMTKSDLVTAADHKLYTDDLYYHQKRSADYLRRTQARADWGIPAELPSDPTATTVVFAKDEFSAPAMWSTHPSDHDREIAAKAQYVRSELDERSCWTLLRDAQATRRRVTAHVLSQSDGPPRKLLAAAEVQAFIDEERAETSFDERYHGMYGGRFLQPGKVGAVFTKAQAKPWSAAKIERVLATLWDDSLRECMDRLNDHEKQRERLAMFASGAGGRTLQLRDRELRKGDVEEADVELLEAVEAVYEELQKRDRRVLRTHAHIALALADSGELELRVRYAAHLSLQEMIQALLQAQQELGPVMAMLDEGRQLSEVEVEQLYHGFGFAYGQLKNVLRRAETFELPSMSNIESGDFFLLDGRLIGDWELRERSLDGPWIGSFLEQLVEVRDKLRRLHFKSLGRLVALQEELVARWQARQPEKAHEAGVSASS